MDRETVGCQIAAVVRLTGLSADTIRAWERRHGLVRPLRDDAGVRRYRKFEVVRLQRARQATENGHPIRMVAAMSDDELLALLESGSQPVGTAEIAASQSVVEAILSAIREYDAPRARRTIRNASLLVEPRELILNVFVPLLDEVGRLWSDGEVTVWQEHLLSDLVASAMGTLGKTMDGNRRDAFLFATPPGELHAFGIAFAAMLAASERFSVDNLGPNIPAAEVVHAAARLRTRCVVVGGPRTRQAAKAAAVFLQELERDLPPSVELWIGGPADFVATSARTQHVPTLSDFAQLLETRP
jgi:methanogenic corrinoid protein MtbC1